MNKQFESLTEITDEKTFKMVRAYYEDIIKYATENGYLKKTEADNKYIREIGRIGTMIADYESIYMKFKNLKFKSPLVISIENQMKRKALNQRRQPNFWK